MESTATLIYDGNCTFCLRSMDWIRKMALPNCLEFLPCQSESRKTRFPTMSENQCMEAMQLVLPDGRILSGAEAIPELLKRLRGWHLCSHLFSIPGIQWLAPYVYRWVAKNRYSISCLLRK